MRTNLVDGLIIGLGISCFVLGARWLFADAPVFWQSILIFIGAIVLGAVQMMLERRRAARTEQKKAIDHTTDDATLLHSPRMAWDSEPPSISEQTPPPTAPEHPAVAEPGSPPNTSPATPQREQLMPEPEAEHSEEKIV